MDERTVIKTKLIFGFLVLLYASITCIYAADTISATQTIRYNETIVSPQETFELGFFNPVNSTNHYVGIWYKKRAQGTIVWVANRDKPLNHTFGEITLTALGVLSLLDTTTGSVLWSSMNSSRISVRNPIGQLLETGNFIVYEDGEDINQENPIWQSFDFMTDTLLPGMKLGWNLVTGVERHFTSWKSDEDPSVGEFSFRIDRRGFPQAILTDGPVIKFRGGPWNGLRFTGFPSYKPNPIYNFTFVLNEREIYYRYDLISSSLTRVVLHPSGEIERLLWTETKQEWTHYWAPISDECDEYAKCGPFGTCNINNSPVCECLKRFEPRSPDQWRGADSSQGCRRTTPLDCGLAGEGFNKYTNLKLPDTQGSWYNETMTLAECEKMCKSNCSCTAYANSNISGTGSGCLLWFGDLIDIRTFDENGDNLYIRMPPSELDLIENRKNSSARKRVRVMLYIAFVVFFFVVSMFLFYRFNRKPEHQRGIPQNEFEHNPETRNDDEDLDLPLFGLSTLLKATQNFSMENKLGEGGFGPVYKGVLEDGQEIAVKRLAKTSTQGLPEFKNEVISISKLQHRNLVKLLGCCIEGVEKMLIYEYMPNKGLDSFLFDTSQSKLLDWPTRYQIINGIARGLLYLHQDSRFRIIHRDLKVSNILLDTDMIPKISDFGTARTFGGKQLEAKTNRVVGTYGYMAPEYAGDGIFSTKSDVYSFGVVVLEIVCGVKNRGFVHKKHSNNLIGHAWRLHNEGKSLQLVAKCVGESLNVFEVIRSIHVGLLCVQRNPEDRPTMTSVILMLGSEGPLPSPKEPGFYVEEYMQDTAQSSSMYGISSTNDLSVTMLDGR